MKYRYSTFTKRFVVFFCLFSISVVVINIIGLLRFKYVSIPNFLIILSSLISSLLTTIYILSGYTQFDLRKHKLLVQKYKKKSKNRLPKIDVFLPCAGEDAKTLERTYQAVAKIDYPKTKIKTFVLDDKGVDEVEYLSAKYKFHYLSRPNKGEFKKAGNLKYGFEHSSGKYILVLDADFAPSPEILYELLPYLEKDSNIGIAQSPQDFIINEDEPKFIQHGDIGIQEFFYRLCQPARNSFAAAICTGTNALYRRRALQKTGGFYQVEHSEDSHTGISITRAGYKIYYVPLVLALGYCPSDYYSLFKQRSRWCQGSLSLMTSKLFKGVKLNFMARLCYFSGFYYYINSIIILTLPFHTLYLLSTPQKPTLIDSLFFLPNVLYILVSFTNFYYPRFSFSVLGNQFFFYWTYVFTIVKSLILKKNEAWTPTGSKTNKNFSYNLLLILIAIYIIVYWSWLTTILINNGFNIVLNDSILLFWVAYNVAAHISFITGILILAMKKAPSNLIHLLVVDEGLEPPAFRM